MSGKTQHSIEWKKMNIIVHRLKFTFVSHLTKELRYTTLKEKSSLFTGFYFDDYGEIGDCGHLFPLFPHFPHFPQYE